MYASSCDLGYPCRQRRERERERETFSDFQQTKQRCEAPNQETLSESENADNEKALCSKSLFLSFPFFYYHFFFIFSLVGSTEQYGRLTDSEDNALTCPTSAHAKQSPVYRSTKTETQFASTGCPSKTQGFIYCLATPLIGLKF